MGLRDIKLAARQALHEAMQVPGYCYPVKGGFKTVDVRVHTEFAGLGDVKGTSFVYAERRDEQDKLIFLASQHQPLRGDVIVISAIEGYRVDNEDPIYNVTIAAAVVPMTAKELLAYVAPPSEGVYSASRGFLPSAAAEVNLGAPPNPITADALVTGLEPTMEVEVI